MAKIVDAEHTHRRPKRKDFEGKTIQRFRPQADNIWMFSFTDGSSFAVQCDISSLDWGVPYMEICEQCAMMERSKL